MIVTPGFLANGLIDTSATREAALRRISMPTTGRLQVSPANIVHTTLGANWGNLAWDVSNYAPSENLTRGFQKDHTAGKFRKRLRPVDCLSEYLKPTANRSDSIFVSTYDKILQTDPRSLSNNTLLFDCGAFGFDGPGNYWECGISNSFDCRKPELWKHNESLVEDWNVFGYKYEFVTTLAIPTLTAHKDRLLFDQRD